MPCDGNNRLMSHKPTFLCCVWKYDCIQSFIIHLFLWFFVYTRVSFFLLSIQTSLYAQVIYTYTSQSRSINCESVPNHLAMTIFSKFKILPSCTYIEYNDASRLIRSCMSDKESTLSYADNTKLTLHKQ